MACKRVNIPRYKVCSGDLDKYVALQSRQLVEPSPGQAEAVEAFVTIKSVWAAIDNESAAIKGIAQFDDVNIENIPTHQFYIRYDQSLDLEVGENFFLYDSRLFRVLSVKNSNENSDILVVRVRETGKYDRSAATA